MSAPPVQADRPAPGHLQDEPPAGRASALARWSPFAFAVAVAVVLLLVTGTSLLDIVRYAAYAGYAVILPGTLVYRTLRRTPHTFIEDVAMGTAVGLALELAGWAVFAALHLHAWMALWPLAVIVPFAAVPSLRRHWRVRGYAPTPLWWSWAVAGTVAFFTSYLWSVFLARNPIVPTSDSTRQYLDLGYQLSLAGAAKHQFPLQVPQVAGEPLYYHWFGYVHMAAASLIGRIDLPVVALRFAVPGLCAAAILLTAVVGWRIGRRPYVGAVAAALFWVVGEFNFDEPVTAPFGTQATFVIWHGMSMIYSWVLLIALIGALADVVVRTPAAAGEAPEPSTVPAIGRGAYVVAALLLFASSGAKASSLPVVLCALGGTGLVLLITRRRIPWNVAAALGIALAAQGFAVVVLFHFQTYGLAVDPLAAFRPYWEAVHPRSRWKQYVIELAVVLAFLLNMQLRNVAILPLAWLRRLSLRPVEWFLLAGAVAGPALYLTFGSVNAQYFTRTGFAFGVLLSACGFAMVAERAGLSRRAKQLLAAVTVVFAGALTVVQLLFAPPQPVGVAHYTPLIPIWKWAAVLGAFGVLVALLWLPGRRLWPALRGRGALVTLTLVLVAGAPGLIMDEYKSWQAPNGGPYFNIDLPRSRVLAARWVRDHSAPDDVVATNVHCLNVAPALGGGCDPRVFWLSAYSERSVLVEGWGFAPRMMVSDTSAFWDQDLLRLNEEAITAPTAQITTELRDRYRVRFLVVDRVVGPESAELRTLAALRYDNGRMAVYQLS